METLKMHSPDLTQANIEKLMALFPNCVTEAQGDDGKVKKAVDFDQLRQELSNTLVEGNAERYHLNWPGKREALLTANAPIAKTLRPCKEESVNFDTTQNLFIEGDNLDALKLLQDNYLEKVKMIYIDPPYNKGKDFIYSDIFAENAEEYFEKSNQKDEEGNRLVANTESNGRFHSDWLSMIYSRVKLSKNLLAEDGIMFLSIDEDEVVNLQKICVEVFGDSNVIGNFPVVMNLKGNQDSYGFAETHEYFIACTNNKNKCEINQFKIDEEVILNDWETDEYGLYKVADNLRATGVNAPREKRPNLFYPIFLNETTLEFYSTDNNQPKLDSDTKILPINPEGKELSWYWGKKTFNQSKHNLILKNTANGWQFYRKQRPKIGDIPTKKPKSFFYKPDYSTSTATIELKNLMGGKYFDAPKPLNFIKDLLILGSNSDSIILDFFAGSATTAHSVVQLNSEDGGNRQFIMAQWPEVTDEKSEAHKAGYNTIAEISKERIRRAGQKILEDNKDKDGIENLDVGFRVLKVDTSNMKEVYYQPDEIDQSQLTLLQNNIKPDRTEEDLLFQVMLDSGVTLDKPIEQKTIDGKTVYFVDENDLVACFDNTEGITEDFVKQLAECQPLKVVFRDGGFKDDSVKINVEQVFKHHSPGTEIKVL